MMDNKSQWQVRKDGRVYAGGPMETLPDAQQRKSMRAAGYQVYVGGKVYRPTDGNAPSRKHNDKEV